VTSEELIVAERGADGAGGCQPVALVVDDGDAVNALDRLLADFEQLAQLPDCRRAGSVHLQPADDADDAGIEQIEAVLGVLRQRAGEVRHFVLGCPEQHIARAPFAPAADSEDRRARQHDERRSPQRQAAQAGSVGRDVHATGFSNGRKIHRVRYRTLKAAAQLASNCAVLRSPTVLAII
jgi:hypothetical protein